MMEPGFFSVTETTHLRLEAMHLFEDCLTKGDDAPLVSFIELQIVHEPPRLQLLTEVADDLHQRLLSLREYQFDVRERVLRTLHESYGIDITSLAPPEALDRYHLLSTDAVMACVREQGAALGDRELLLLCKMVEASVQMAGQLHHDIQLTQRLHLMVLDWLDGMNATVARQNWSSTSILPEIKKHQH